MSEREATTPACWVGIGASAGGLEALRLFAKNLIPGTNAVYVVVQHMSPQHKSLLASLIGRETDLDVKEITDGVSPVPNTIYVAPSNFDVIVQSGQLRLVEPSKDLASPKPSVDRFFRSLAEAYGGNTVAIVVSGTGSDGAYGAQAIHAAGGHVIAQSRETAKYFGMPDSVIKSGVVDAVMAPDEMGLHIARLISSSDTPQIFTEPDGPSDPFSRIMAALQNHGKVDFNEYKPSTVRRRMERRITSLGLQDLESYAAYLEQQPQEIGSLFKDMLISVTSFFRDPQQFAALGRHLQPLLSDHEDKVLRVWVPGCATGEEAFSIAILILEGLGGLEALDRTHLQIFATDVDIDALTIARRGFYPAIALQDIPEDLRDRYFTRSGGGYTIHSGIRECVIFTNHNLCEDPPFSNIDIVTCRNLLIYFGSQLQAKVMARLHYALNPNGLLLLGKSESASGSEELFRQLAPDAKVYRRRTRIDQRRANVAQLISKGRRAADTQLSEEHRQNMSILQSMFDGLVRAVGPDCLLVTADFQIKRVYGNVDQFISLSEGDVRGVNIGMIRNQFRHEVRTLMTLALRDSEPRFGQERAIDGQPGACVQVAVYPLPATKGSEELAVVAFRQWFVEEIAETEIEDVDGDAAPVQIALLERELNVTRSSLQQTVEELETTNEELQALNEELQSGNEELQSTNEELETANEELQSTNEELITVNEELQINSQELSQINQELDSILANIPAPTLVVDAGLQIVRCSESARAMFQIDASLGRPHLSQCAHPKDFPDLASMVAEVIRVGSRIEEEFDVEQGHGKVIAAPYFNPKGELIGATAIVSEGRSQGGPDEISAFIDGLPSMVWQKDQNNRVMRINQAAADFLGIEPQDVVGADMKEIAPFLVRDDAADAAIIDSGKSVLARQERNVLEDGQTVCHLVSRVPFSRPNGDAGLYVIAGDVSEAYRANLDQRTRNDLADQVINATPAAIEYVDAKGILRLQNTAARLLDDEQIVGKEWLPETGDGVWLEAETGEPVEIERHPILRGLRGEVFAGELVSRVGNSGAETLFWAHGSPVRDDSGEVVGAVGTTVQLPGFGSVEVDVAASPDAIQHGGFNIMNWNTLSGELVLSPALQELFRETGLPPLRTFSEFRGLVHLEDGERFDAAIDSHLNERERFACTFRLVRGDQDDLWVETRGQAVCETDGAPTNFIMTLMDVTESWAEYQEVNRRTALADMALESGGLGIWRLDLSRMRVELSDAASEILRIGSGESDVALDLVLSTIRKEDRPTVRHGIRSVADEAIPFSATVRLDELNDVGRSLQISGRAERDPGGSVISVIGILREAEASSSDNLHDVTKLSQSTAAE